MWCRGQTRLQRLQPLRIYVRTWSDECGVEARHVYSVYSLYVFTYVPGPTNVVSRPDTFTAFTAFTYLRTYLVRRMWCRGPASAWPCPRAGRPRRGACRVRLGSC